MIILTPFVGYLLGSLPTANGIARVWGVDLRKDGSGNPGANNARRLGGLTLASVVLAVELAKGAFAFFAGYVMAGDLGGILSGVAAVAGNVYNVWYGFSGGKGLAITGGVLLASWPVALGVLLIALAVLQVTTRSSGRATLATLMVLVVLAITWVVLGWPNAWGVSEPAGLLLLAGSIAAILTPKHLYDARNPVSAPAHPSS